MKIGGWASPSPEFVSSDKHYTQTKRLLFSGLFDWQRNEPHRFRGFHPQQDGVLACGTRVTESLADFGGVCDRLAADVEDHVTGLDAAFSGRTIGVDADHRDTLITGTGNVLRRSEIEPETRRIAGRHVIAGLGFCLFLIRHLAESQSKRLDLALANQGHLDLGARCHHPDFAGELTRVLDRRTVDFGDHVASNDARFARWTIGLRLSDDRAFGLFQAKAVGDVSRNRLDLDAQPGAINAAMLLELANHHLGGRCRNIEANPDRTTGR